MTNVIFLINTKKIILKILIKFKNTNCLTKKNDQY